MLFFRKAKILIKEKKLLENKLAETDGQLDNINQMIDNFQISVIIENTRVAAEHQRVILI